MNSHYGMQIIDIFNKMLSHPYDPLTAETLKKNSEQPMPDEETMLDKSFFE